MTVTDWTVIAPWEIPVWATQMSHWGVTNPAARVEWVQSLIDIGLHSGVEVFFTAAKVTGRDLEGTGELIPVGGASVVSQRGSEEPRTWKWTMGSEATQFDVNAFALAKAAEVLCYVFISFYLISSITIGLPCFFILIPHPPKVMRFHLSILLRPDLRYKDLFHCTFPSVIQGPLSLYDYITVLYDTISPHTPTSSTIHIGLAYVGLDHSSI